MLQQYCVHADCWKVLFDQALHFPSGSHSAKDGSENTVGAQCICADWFLEH